MLNQGRKLPPSPPPNDEPFRSRIIGLEYHPAGELIDYEHNWRRHPESQKKALRASLEQFGIVDAIIARHTPQGLEIVDGHCRKDIARDTLWPVIIVELGDREMISAVATLDTFSEIVEVAPEATKRLLAAADLHDEVLQGIANTLRKQAGLPDAIEAPDYESLGQGDPVELWPIIKLVVTKETFNRYQALMLTMIGKDETEKFGNMLAYARAEAEADVVPEQD